MKRDAMKPTSEIVVVDDEADMRNLLRDFLATQGYGVRCYSTAEAAMAAVSPLKLPHAIVADLRMEPVDGMALLRDLKLKYPNLPVVLFSAAASPKDREEAYRIGAAHVLAKPFPLAELAKVLSRIK